MSPWIFLKVELHLWSFQTANETQDPVAYIVLDKSSVLGSQCFYLTSLSHPAPADM